ncbi:MAG TPA: hypothetical protein VFS67_36330 [Polyangiaceae bacterium]|jgi:hypothetical protein|nr:hypothetical protein [Polyangiaceae bacterium]
MQDQDVLALDESERKLLDLSFQTGLAERRIRNIAFDVAITSALVIIATAYGLRTGWLAAVAIVLLVVSGLEKVSYARSVMHYRGLVRKLVHRVEQLEGAQQTALGAHPAADLQHRIDVEHESRREAAPDSGAERIDSEPMTSPTHH